MSETGGRIRVLCVDDEPGLGDVVSRYLERVNDDLVAEVETSASDALDRLDREEFDCIVSDHDMPGQNGLEFLRNVRVERPNLPFILFTGKGSEEIASDAVSAGVTDYLQKETGTEQYTVLANRVERAVEESRAKTALQERERQLSTLISNLPGIAYRCRTTEGWPMTFVSEGADELLGYSTRELERGTVDYETDVIHPDDRAGVRQRVETRIRAGEPFEVTYRARTKDGDVRWLWERGRAVETNGDEVSLEGFITDITERKTREREAQAVKKRYRSLFEAAPDALVLADAETGEIVDVNDAAEDLFGRSATDLIGRPQTDLHPPEAAERYRGLFERHVADGQGIDHLLDEVQQIHVVDGDGDRVPVEISASVVEVDDRTLIQGFFRDLSNRRERERTLEQYRTMVENVGDPMYVLDADGTIRMVNRAMADRLGYRKSEIVGERPTAFMTPEDVATGTELLAELLGDDDREWDTFEMRTIDADGTETLSEDKVAPLVENGEYVGSVGVIRDVTERETREQELERYETIVQAVGDPVYALDADGRFTFVNEAIESVTGYEPAALVGEPTSVLLPEADVERGERVIQDLLDGDASHGTYEMALETRDGDRVPCENRLALLPFDGEFRGTAGVVRDITARKERERRLEQFASVVSHDLQNPLRVLQGHLDLARRSDDDIALQKMDDAIGRMERLIDDLLTLARQGETVGETEPVALPDAARRAWETTDSAGATLDVSTTSTVEADPERLRQLLENLFGNAVEHGSTGNRTPGASDDAVEHGSTGSQASSDDAVEYGSTGNRPAVDDSADVTVSVGDLPDGFYVADDGPGIPADRRSEVFDHGYTTGDSGTGFGLSIVATIADAHGWDMTVTESESGGARFEITGL
jgi:PAS domain S-box-containing protein